MQESVTRSAKGIGLNARSYIGLILAIVFLGVVVVGVLIAFSVKSKKFDFISGKEFYVYYTSAEKSLSGAQTSAKNQQSIGGAGYIFENYNFYISAFLYENFEDAKAVAKKNITAYPDGGVTAIKTQKLTKKAKKVMKNEEKYLNCVQNFENAFYDFLRLSQENDEKLLSEVVVFNKVFKRLEGLVDLSKKFEDINSPMSFELDSLIAKIKKYLASSNTTIERSSGLKLLCFEIIKQYNTIANWLNSQ